MSDPTPTPAAPAAAPTTAEPAAGGNPQPTSETDWHAKFEAQQKVNRDLEQKFNGARDEQSQMRESLAKALGITPEQGVPDVAVLAATVQTLQEQFTQTQLANTVLTIAAENGITEQADIDLLRSVKDEATMRTIAARIKAAPGSDPASPSPGPRPDLTQGAAGTPAAGDPASEFQSFLSRQMAG